MSEPAVNDLVGEPPSDEVHQPPRWAPLTLVAFVGLVICTNIANATWAKLVDVDDPNAELLLLLSPKSQVQLS